MWMKLAPKGIWAFQHRIGIQPVTSLIKGKGNLNPERVRFSEKDNDLRADSVSVQDTEVFVLNTQSLVGMKTVFLCS